MNSPADEFSVRTPLPARPSDRPRIRDTACREQRIFFLEMSTPEQLRTIIRFGLEQLSVRNAHHEFEHLCRHLTRARICSNVVPSTGPVSARGDQGRDFETFRTYLSTNGMGEGVFVGLASKTRIAFACTIQASDL